MRRLLALLTLALALASPAARAEVTVFAAASLKTALDRIAQDWQAATGSRVVLVYGGSGAMARQIGQGAPANIFISAAVDWMDVLEAAGQIVPESRRDLAGNRLVLVAHGRAAPVRLGPGTDLGALLGEGRLSVGQVDAVPAGQYAAEALRSLGLWDQVQDRLAQSDNVRAALRLVALGETPLGIVFASDALAEPQVSVIAIFPDTSHRPIRYPAALVAGADTDAAAAFLAHLFTPAAQGILAADGFLPLP